MTDTAWLEALKAGDEVAVHVLAACGGYFEIRKVTAAGKKFVSVPYHGRYRRNCNRNNGWDAAHHSTIRPVTDEIRRGLEDEKFRSQALRTLEKMGRYDWAKLPTDQLRRIVAILNEGTTP